MTRPLWQCPRCGARFVTRNMPHSCGRAALADWYQRMTDDARALFDELERTVAACGEYYVAPAKTRIAFMGRVRFASITAVRQHDIRFGFMLPYPLRSRRFIKVEEVVPGWWSHRLSISSAKDFDAQLRAWIRRSYRLVGMQERLRSRRRRTS